MSSERTHTARLPLRLPGALLERCTAHARERGEPLSEFARRALEQQLSRDRLDLRLRAVREAFRHQVFVDQSDKE